jgi:formylglycine-generating enzyme required for sulfatase activity
MDCSILGARRSALAGLVCRIVCAALLMAAYIGSGKSAGSGDQQPVTEPPSPARATTVWRTPTPPTDPGMSDIWVNPTDGMEMVYIPPGEFLLGLSSSQIDALLRDDPTGSAKELRDAQPQCEVHTAGYWIGRTEVTNGQYQQFVGATGHSVPRHWQNGKIPAGTERFPVTYVSQADAEAYCRWVGGRLPTEIEWEKAARGTDGRLFPWGNTWAADRCRNFETTTGEHIPIRWETWLPAFEAWEASHGPVRDGIAAVGSYPADKSPYGCMDMAGNVSEWCAGWYDAKAYQRYARGNLAQARTGKHVMVRGGAWSRFSLMSFCTAYREHGPPDYYRLHDTGFRHVRDVAAASHPDMTRGKKP